MTDPTDNDLDVLLAEHWPAFATSGARPLQGMRAAMRDAIAKWGTPQPVVREPLTGEQLDAAISSAKKVKPHYVGWATDQRREWGRAVERAHGIKGKEAGNADT